jgi:MFS transporter, MHS family, proline/betaine transporter
VPSHRYGKRVTAGPRATPVSRARVAGMIGNTLEWYDFAVYGYFAPVLGRHFFPGDDPAASLIASFGVFAVGFLARPVGAALFGNLGDRAGRRRVLLVSVLVMGVPTYADIGTAAPALLVVLRLCQGLSVGGCQGLSVGGEMTGSITYMIEESPAERRGLAGSFSYLGLGVGCLMGAAAGSLLTGLLSPSAVDSWGWRLPFLFGSVIAVCGFLVRRYGLTEAFQPADAGSSKRKGPLRRAVTQYRREIVQAIGIAALFAGGFYLVFVYLTTYLVRVAGNLQSAAFRIDFLNLALFAAMAVAGGYLGDRLGFRRVLLACAVMTLLLAVPLFWLVDHDEPALSFLGQFGFVLILAPYGGLFATTMALLFPPAVRMSGFSLAFNIAFAALGGTTPVAASYLIHRGDGGFSPAYVLMACAIVSIVSLIWAWPRLPGGKP